MITVRVPIRPMMPMLAAAALLLASGNTALAQSGTQACKPAPVIPVVGTEPPARLSIDPPLAEPLASRGVVVIHYCAEHMRLLPVFGPGALSASPRVGHVHVTVDRAPWRWADASGTPIILQGVPPGSHEVLLELVDANHQVVDKGTVRFDVPPPAATHAPH